MLINIVLLQDDDRTVTDIVAFDDFKQADRIANDLSAKFGRNRVQRTSLTVNELPAFWGLTNQEPPNTVCTGQEPATVARVCEHGYKLACPHGCL